MAPCERTLTDVVIVSPRACTYVRSCLLAIWIGQVLPDRGASQLLELYDAAALGYPQATCTFSDVKGRYDSNKSYFFFWPAATSFTSLFTLARTLGAIIRDRGPLLPRRLITLAMLYDPRWLLAG